MPVETYRLWTADEIQRLREMAELGFSRAEIAKALGRSKAAVMTKAAILHVDILHANRMRRSPN